MIRRIKSNKMRIPSSLRQLAKTMVDFDFKQIQLDLPVYSIAKIIPYPVERQLHSLVVLGCGHVEMHTDDISDCISTSFCIPFHLPKGARLCQEGGYLVRMKEGVCYSFNQRERHGVDVPDSSYTYSAFIVVDVLSKEAMKKAG